jgi:hypothetical protein
MKIVNIKNIIGLVVLLSVAVLASASASYAQANDDLRQPELPPVCAGLQVPAGNKVFFRTFATGVQVYKWNGASWDFVAPVANLYTNNNYRGEVGFHYAGPTWESNSGSKVVAARAAGCQPDSTAIAWLLLQKVSTEGRGIFRNVSFIQRVNTAGGLSPATPGSIVGEEKRVPYTTEYFFYRPENLFGCAIIQGGVFGDDSGAC